MPAAVEVEQVAFDGQLPPSHDGKQDPATPGFCFVKPGTGAFVVLFTSDVGSSASQTVPDGHLVVEPTTHA